MTVPQTVPTPTPTNQSAPTPHASASPLDFVATIKTTLSGFIDPSFIKMDNARAAVIDTMHVKHYTIRSMNMNATLPLEDT